MESIEFLDNEFILLHRVVGKNVAKIRKMKKVTQLDLSLSIGYNSTSVIAKAEAGTEGRHFSVEQLYKIAKILNVPMSSFFEDIDTISEN
ncbi:MAG: helix-turn-helix transcriptional regulator [Aliarcobacter sp.]|nr:helix-turn-helix transcriptional regulator [Aliarcobacter sp.]